LPGQPIPGEISCHLICLSSTRCLVSHDISVQALVHFLAIPEQPIIKLLEAESLTTGFWRAVNEGPQGSQAVCYLHLPLLGSCQQESLSG
uniref:Uncharacterized protein n=1 Tax=Amazona collaria TaxID=241587 RepID=A0A8B9F015_9PSIT